MKPCTGRDETCNAVLNDHWVSHPTWASEDSGFIAHKKNTHEEGLHRIEEERHDYDIYTAIVGRVIQFLEPFAQQVHVMSPEQRSNFTLHEAKEGNIPAILRKVLTKIYGREHALSVIDDLEEMPANVIPVVLSRCRHIGEHWKQCQVSRKPLQIESHERELTLNSVNGRRSGANRRRKCSGRVWTTKASISRWETRDSSR